MLRGVAKGLDTKATRLSKIISGNVHTAREGEDLDEVLKRMADSRIRHLPDVNDKDGVIGIISIDDIASKRADEKADGGQSPGAISAPV